MEVTSAFIPESARQNFQVRLFSRHVDPGMRPFREHHHFPFELVLIKDGCGAYATLKTTYDIQPGDVFLFACNEIHCITEIGAGRPLHLMNIHIEPCFLWPEDSSLLSPQFLSMPFSHSASFENRLPRSHPATEKITRLMLDAEQEFARRQSDYPLMIRLRLMEIFVTLIRELNYADNQTTRSRTLQHAQVMRSAVAFIHAHLTEPMTLRQIAGAVQMSPNYFCSVFRQTGGVTPWEYITSARVRLAMRLMEQFPDETLLNIAVRSGFNNTQNFNKMFVRHIGCTPSDYKRCGYTLPDP